MKVFVDLDDVKALIILRDRYDLDLLQQFSIDQNMNQNKTGDKQKNKIAQKKQGGKLQPFSHQQNGPVTTKA